MSRSHLDEERPRWHYHSLAGSLFFFLGIDLFIISPLIPEISSFYEVSVQDAAVIAITFNATYMLLGPFAALFTDQMTRKNAIFLGGIVFGIAGILAAFAPTLTALAMARVIAAVGASLMGAPVWAYVTETARPGRTGPAVGLVAGLFAAGQIFGVPAGVYFAAIGHWQFAFLGLGIASLIAGVLVKLFLGNEIRVPFRVSVLSSTKASLAIWMYPNISVRVFSNLFAQGACVSAYTFAGALMV